MKDKATALPWPEEQDLQGTAREILRREPEPKVVELVEAGKFFAGEQWPEEIRLNREQNYRPCLVFNRLPLVLQGILLNSLGEEPLTLLESEKLIAVIVRRLRNSQQMYNYARSTVLEHDARLREQLPAFMCLRSKHPSWIVRVCDRITRWVDREA